jgi:superfamily II DNA/RNA helicase
VVQHTVPCRPAIDELLKALPSKAGRQTVLFSATFPADIASLASYALRPGYQMVDTVGETAQQTADKVLSVSQ